MMKEKREVLEGKIEQKKGKNKGFSLVELIVVIAIMAILAVVIAPQVIKYIGKSKDSADAANISLYKSAVATALADEAAYSEVSTLADDLVITVSGDPATPSFNPDTVPLFKAEFDEIMSSTYPLPKTGTNTKFKITIDVIPAKDTIGKVTVVPAS